MPFYVLGGTTNTVFGVLTLCRVLYTLRTGEIASKHMAARWALGHVATCWRPLSQRLPSPLRRLLSMADRVIPLRSPYLRL